MKKMLLAVALLAVLSGSVLAVDCAPPLLCDADTLKAPTKPAVAACEPPPPVCAPPPPACPPPPPAPVVCEAPAAPVCAPAPQACPPAAPRSAVAAAAPAPREERIPSYRVVPVKRKVYEEESYTVQEKRTQEHEEIRTKTIKPKAPRLARVMRPEGVELAVIRDKPKVVPYKATVRTEYTVPVTKTRTVAREVEEYKVVEDRRWFSR